MLVRISRCAGLKAFRLILLTGVFVASLTGCKPLPPSKSPELFTPEEARGSQVFQDHCARCHYPTSTKGLKGPGLQAITKIKALPSGLPPTDEHIAQTILHGRGMMPAVSIDDNDLSSLLAYIHTL